MLGVGVIALMEDTMKKTVFIALVLVIGIALAFPKPSYSHVWPGIAARVVGAAAACCRGRSILLGTAGALRYLVAAQVWILWATCLPTATPRLHMLTALRPMGIGILITDRGTIPATGTVVIMVKRLFIAVTTDVVGK